MQITLPVPLFLSESQRVEVGEEVVSLIKQRTADNRDVDGNEFAPYSDYYIASKEFEIAGKSASDVNLRLTDDMMESIVVVSTSPGSITIGFNNSYAEDKAAWAHASDNGPARRFFGISDSELQSILDLYQAPEELPARLGERVLSRILRLGN